MKVTLSSTDTNEKKPVASPPGPRYKMRAVATVTVDIPDITLEALIGEQYDDTDKVDPDDIALIVSRMGEDDSRPAQAGDLLTVFLDYFKPEVTAEVDLERLDDEPDPS